MRHRMHRYGLLAMIVFLCGGCGPKGGTRTGPVLPRDNSVVFACEDALLDVCFVGPATLPGNVALMDDGAAGRIGIAVGRAATILRTENGGRSWRRVWRRDDKGPEFTTVVFRTAKDGWVVSRDLLLHTSDAGKTWRPAARLPGNFYYFGPCASGPGRHYQMQPPTCGATVWTTDDGGTTWAALPGKLPRNDYEAVFFFDDAHGWLAGNQGHLAATADGGATWQVHDIAEGGHLTQIQFASPMLGWARPRQGHQGGIWASRDGGATWARLPVGVVPHHGISDMQFLDERMGFLLEDAGADGARVMRTDDGGSTWTAVREFKAPLRASCFVDAETGWLVGENGWIVKIAADIRGAP